jgi:tetratricopeptide (TPR) repeat protein
MKRGELQAAIDQYQSVLSLKTDRDDLLAIYTSLGVAYRQSGDYNAANESFRQLLRLDPSNMQVVMAMGRVQMLTAADLLARELGRHPTAEGFAQLGILWERAGEIERATRAYQAALMLNSKLAVARDGMDRLARNYP